MNFDEKLQKILERYAELDDKLSSGDMPDIKVFTKMSKELSDLKPVAEAIRHYQQLQADIIEYQTILKDKSADKELKELAETELPNVKEQLEVSEHKIKILLLPKDVDDDKNVILELRAGTGGEEASLFAADLMRMYQRYADLQGWKSEVISLNESDTKGVKEAVINLSGKGVFARLKFESGVHLKANYLSA